MGCPIVVQSIRIINTHFIFFYFVFVFFHSLLWSWSKPNCVHPIIANKNSHAVHPAWQAHAKCGWLADWWWPMHWCTAQFDTRSSDQRLWLKQAACMEWTTNNALNRRDNFENVFFSSQWMNENIDRMFASNISYHFNVPFKIENAGRIGFLLMCIIIICVWHGMAAEQIRLHFCYTYVFVFISFSVSVFFFFSYCGPFRIDGFSVICPLVVSNESAAREQTHG